MNKFLAKIEIWVKKRYFSNEDRTPTDTTFCSCLVFSPWRSGSSPLHSNRDPRKFRSSLGFWSSITGVRSNAMRTSIKANNQLSSESWPVDVENTSERRVNFNLHNKNAVLLYKTECIYLATISRSRHKIFISFSNTIHIYKYIGIIRC